MESVEALDQYPSYKTTIKISVYNNFMNRYVF